VKKKLIPCPGIHSNTDILAYFTKSGVVHMGDMFLSESFPDIGRSIKEKLTFMDKVIPVVNLKKLAFRVA
jgi:hypothetical protein